jgi:hypothetical protein
MLNLLSMVSLLLEVLIHHGCCVAEYSSLEEGWKVDEDRDAAHKRSSASTEPVNEESLHDVRRSMLLMKKQSSSVFTPVPTSLHIPRHDAPGVWRKRGRRRSDLAGQVDTAVNSAFAHTSVDSFFPA